MNSIIEIIYYLGAVQGFILTFFLFSLKANVIANRILGLLTFSWGAILFIFAAQSDGLFLNYPHLLRTIYNLQFLFWPLLFLNVKYLIISHKKFQRLDLLHFLPLVVYILMYADFYLMSAEDKLSNIYSTSGYYFWANIIGDEILSVQGVVYSILSLSLLRNYQKRIQDYISSYGRYWLRALTIGIVLMLVAWTFGIVDVHLRYLNINLQADLFIYLYLIIVVIIYYISYTALKTPEVFKLEQEELHVNGTRGTSIQWQKEDAAGRELTGDFVAASASDDQFNDLNERLLEDMNVEKPYLDTELSLQALADQIDISRHQLSALINKKHEMNFYEFINRYRIEEVKHLFTDPANKHYKLISLAYDSGFNSKASFNRIFKQFTLQTPSEYLASLG